MLSIQQLRYRNILNSVDFSAKSGEFIGIVGPNGSGKTTLLRLVAGILRDFSGKIGLDGQNLAELSSRQVARLVSYVPQIVSNCSAFPVFPTGEWRQNAARCRTLRLYFAKWEFPI